MSHTNTNSLINETSPYLLQHAYNPVDWMPWNEESLSLAKKENKLILISIGYAACHWCHVMEHESFEDTAVAKTMNSNFVNIKVDREERPDVDQVYMNAVQLMTGQGGWPLNVVALPDGRPVWGGTYFKKDHWINVLEQLAKLYKDNPDKLIDYAEKLEQGIKNMDLVALNSEEKEFNREFISEVVDEWSNNFDRQKGGPSRAPKFMLPNNYQFLLRYAYQNNDEKLMGYVNLTLTKMALGGIYDQIGGGFSRYSVDTKWHVPHFEKMLYDNAQLVSLYSEAFSLTKKSLYRDVVVETLSFIEKELTSSEGVFYSSLDADSLNKNEELEEGAFYVWTQKELKIILGDDFDLFKEYYNINDYGYWEKGNYVLIRKIDDHDFAAKNNLKESELLKKKEEWKNALLMERDKRARPRLDDKSLSSWNALMIKAYVDAFKSVGDQHYLQVAIKAMKFILTRQLSSDGRLFRNYKNGKSTIYAYLIDYATTIEALIALYQVTSEEKYINTARDLTNFTFDNFFDDNSSMFFFTSKNDPELVTRNIEFRDNVIPASNSIMAKNLFELSHYFSNSSYLETSSTMLNNIKPQIKEYGSGFSNWLDLKLNFTFPYYEVAIVGRDAHNFANELNSHYLPNILTVISEKASEAPLLKDRLVENKTFIYVCVDNTCQLPVSEINDALKLISFQ